MNSRDELCERIARGLAEQGYTVVDHFLEEDEVMALLCLEEFNAGLSGFKQASVGKQGKMINENIRGDYIQWIDRETAGSALRVYFGRLAELISYINQNLFLSLKDFEVHLTVYPEGSSYKRHLDQFRQDDHRKLSVILYLNESWEPDHGGQLRMYTQEGPIDVLPMAGRFVCFRSDIIEHEVLAATRPRRSLTGWMTDRLAGLGNL